MKRAAIILGLILLFSVLVGTSFGKDLLIEDWEKRVINNSKWLKFGSPLPVIYSPGHNSNYAFNVNGDNWWHSGVYSKKIFSTSGVYATFWLKGNSVGSYGMAIFAGFTTSQKQGEGNLIPLSSIDVQSSSCCQAVTFNAGVGVVPFEDRQILYPGDSWHKYAIHIQTDGRVAFYMDGTLKFRSKGVIDFNSYPTTRFQIARKATFAPMLADDIRVSNPRPVPTPTPPPPPKY